MENPKELFFESEQLKAAGKKKKEAAPARSLPHTAESREEEERVNPPGRSGGRGYAAPFLNIEDVPDTGANPEEEAMIKEVQLSESDYKEIDEEDEEDLSPERIREEDYPEYYASREEWERHLRSLPDPDYAMRLRAKFARKESDEMRRDSETAIHKEHKIERQVPDALVNKPIDGAYRLELLRKRTDKKMGRGVQARAGRRLNVQKPKRHRRKGGGTPKRAKVISGE